MHNITGKAENIEEEANAMSIDVPFSDVEAVERRFGSVPSESNAATICVYSNSEVSCMRAGVEFIEINADTVLCDVPDSAGNRERVKLALNAIKSSHILCAAVSGAGKVVPLIVSRFLKLHVDIAARGADTRRFLDVL